MFLHLSVDFSIDSNLGFFTTFLIDDGTYLPLPGIGNKFLISQVFSLFALVELTNNADSLLSDTSSVMAASFPASLLSTIN